MQLLWDWYVINTYGENFFLREALMSFVFNSGEMNVTNIFV